jgi:hypothetical protein
MPEAVADIVELVIQGVTLEVDVRLEEVEPMAYRFLLSFAKDNELKTRDGRVAERTELARVLRAGDTD